MFEMAIKDESAYPPKCCGSRILLKAVRRKLPTAILRQFQQRQVEMSTKDKTYCHACLTFVAPQSVHNERAICQQCRSSTCTRCKEEWHFGRCTQGLDPTFVAYVRSHDLKRCPNCGRLIARDGGCKHIKYVLLENSFVVDLADFREGATVARTSVMIAAALRMNAIAPTTTAWIRMISFRGSTEGTDSTFWSEKMGVGGSFIAHSAGERTTTGSTCAMSVESDCAWAVLRRIRIAAVHSLQAVHGHLFFDLWKEMECVPFGGVAEAVA